MDLPSNPDILHRIFEFLGPRSTCLTLSCTNRSLRQLSQSDSLWRIFWLRRCLFFREDDTDLLCSLRAAGSSVHDDDRNYCHSESKVDNDGCDRAVHKAALTFRHAIHSLNLQNKLFASTNDINTTTSSLYAGYIQTHSMMKLTNLRPVKFTTSSDDYDDGQQQQEDDDDDAQNYQLRQQLCTQTWPGQLSLLNERLLQPNNNDATNTNNTVTCLNSADIWCDHPTCNQARCGPQGCLRCYRFLPPPVQHLQQHRQQQQQQQQQQQLGGNRMAGDLDGPGDILGAWRRECTDRNYDVVSFVRCGWCSVSLCNEHIDVVYNNHQRRRREEAVWYKCDECNLSSCPQCISQVFPMQPPQTCRVVTAGKRCGRQICSNCIWAVGKEGGDDCGMSHNIPGGKISNDDSSEVVSIRARDEDGRRRMQLLKEKEMCCSKCLRHVEFRWRELSAVFDMFGGLVP